MDVAQVRSFNRTVTQRVGALDDEYLARDRSLGQSRVLWEIGAEGSDVRSLRARLDLDSGYLSRLLRSLEADGLVTVDSNPADGRVRTARLTEAGLAERAELDRLSDEAAASILLPLSEPQRERLVAAMAEVERLLVASSVQIAPCDPRHPHARFCLTTYFAELARRFEGGYDPGDALPVEDDEVTPPAGVMLVATLHAEPVGCVCLKLHGDEPAELKRMWVAGTVRGLGVGRRLLAEIEAYAVAQGVRALRLETNRVLSEAIGLYRSAGFREIPPYNAERYAHHWFEKKLAS